MTSPASSARGASPFSRGAVLGVVLVGFTAFIAMLYFIGIGDTGGDSGSGRSPHANTNGLDGYSGLVQLLREEGYTVTTSRGSDALDTTDLLVLTPQSFTDPAEFGRVLENRQYLGPTLVILPKWFTARPQGNIAEKDRERMRNDWVELVGAEPQGWTAELPAPYTLNHQIETLDKGSEPRWSGLGARGELPTLTIAHAERDASFEPLVIDAQGRTLALNVIGDEGTDYYENAHWTVFVVDPDLVNNYGLADPRRAAVALALVREAGYGDLEAITFDMSMNGYGNSTNLLTLAFEPPFLAATLCLILAMLIIGWRAFLRFGPTAVADQEIAFGKRRLVANGAGLIVRARRLGLLAGPYVALTERRLARALGLIRPTPEAIDRALALRLPQEEPFTLRAARLNNADKPMDILRAAQALNELTGKLTR
jgi:hypothetical protein